MKNWHPQFGDRFQKLIFIGKPEILEDIKNALQSSLLTEEEMSKGGDYSHQLSDPFNDWSQMFLVDEDIDDVV